MKVKLLKTIRKKYSWYFNKEKYPVLINHVLKKATVYNKEYCIQKTNSKIEDVKCEHTEWALRIFKKDILFQYGWYFTDRINKVDYKMAMSIFNKKSKKYDI